MKMVAAANLKRARDQVESAAVYAEKINNLVHGLSMGMDKAGANRIRLLGGTGNDKVHMLLVITSDRGLCGSFNQAVCKLTKNTIDKLQSEGKKVKLICIGKKGISILKHHYKDLIVRQYENLAGKKGIRFEQIRIISDYIIDEFNAGVFDHCTIFFSKFKSAISQIPTEKTIIPLEHDEESTAMYHGCEFEPNEEYIIEKLVPQNIMVQFYTAMLESISSEHAARMTAMDNATRNSGEMIKKLQLVYNRTRQAYITKELIEIISGAEAV
jgi:F-type H+-transporting ATPase subunit gamma